MNCATLIYIFFILLRGSCSIILYFNFYSEWFPDHPAGQIDITCSIECTVSQSHNERDADMYFVLWNFPLIVSYLKRFFTYPKVPQIAITGEGYHYIRSSLLHLHILNQWFDGAATLNVNSEIPNYPCPISMQDAAKIEVDKQAANKAVLVISNCQSLISREKVAQLLSEIISVDIYGKCNPDRSWPKCGIKDCSKPELIRRYKLYFAFENGISEGYVSEKVYEGFQAGTLPVYFGTEDVKDYLPEHSYISVTDFNSVRELGEYLVKVLDDDELYQSYFEWKKKDFSEEYLTRWSPIWDNSVFCRACKYVYAKKHNLAWNQIEQNFDESLKVPPPSNHHLATHWFIILIPIIVVFLLLRGFRSRFSKLLSKMYSILFGSLRVW